MLVLTSENYFSKEANEQYMSVSRFKNYLSCEAMALAIDKGDFTPEQSDALLQGSYIDAWNNGELDKFKRENPALYATQGKNKGELYAKYQDINDCISTLENDALCMEFLSGQKQVIFTAEMFGIPWKICIDSFNPDKNRLVDLKCVKDFEWQWDSGEKRRVSFVEAWKYHLQLAVYRKVTALSTGIYYTPYIVAVTKQDIPDKAIVTFEQNELNEQLDKIEDYLPRILDVIEGVRQPHRCNKCVYCRSTKVLTLKDIKHHSSI